ncbi:MAG: DNA translocase FtsK 4TM domain-containing protein [Alphaproteobacteria bacterium]|nr:DNA translocase FtsK 4TM domain-containing protein [Alphaproteobacteria bacterium]
MAVDRLSRSRKFFSSPAAYSINYRRRLGELRGILYFLLGIGLTIITAVYGSDDPSLFYSGPRESSWLSMTAATIAEGGQRLMGISYFLMSGFLAFWGLRLMRHHQPSRLWNRLPALFGMILTSSIALEWVKHGFGGKIGSVWANRLARGLTTDSGLVPIWLKLLVLLLTLVAALFSLGLSKQDYRRILGTRQGGLRTWFQRPTPAKPRPRPRPQARARPLRTPPPAVIPDFTAAPEIPLAPPQVQVEAEPTPLEPENPEPILAANPLLFEEPAPALAPLAPLDFADQSSPEGPVDSAMLPANDSSELALASPASTVPQKWWQKASATVMGTSPQPWWRQGNSSLEPLSPRMEPSWTPSLPPPPPPLQPVPVPVPVPPRVDLSYGFEPQPSLSLQQQPFDPDHPNAEEDFGDGRYRLPPTSLLNPPPPQVRIEFDPVVVKARERELEGVLGDFGVRGEIVKTRPGPIVTLYELDPAAGTKSSRVIGLADDIARSMSAHAVRIAVVPGRSVIGIELPNQTRELVAFRELAESLAYRGLEARLPLILGKDIGGSPVIVDLAKMPHLLIAGTTGSGKSVGINAMILSLLFRLTPEECRIIMIDPKMLELSVYDGIPHLLTPVVTEPKKAIVALKWVVKEMEDRYRKITRLGVRNIEAYNARIGELQGNGVGSKSTHRVQVGFDARTGVPITEEQELELKKLAKIVVIVDEMADLMLVAGKDIDASIQRLAQMARAAGIHLIMATQRPSVDVITGTIKANFPTRISFMVTSKIDSRTILGEGGAEQLLGQGDMLYMAGGGRITRVHGPFVSDLEVERVVDFLKSQGEPVYVDAVTEEANEAPGLFGNTEESSENDELYEQALEVVARDRKASTSHLQKHLQLGFIRASRLIDRMEAEGIIGPANHVGKREIFLRKAPASDPIDDDF